jgi:uncharacterized protein (TIGR02145 family)
MYVAPWLPISSTELATCDGEKLVPRAQAAHEYPALWHVPSDAEFKTLEVYLGISSAVADTTGNSRGTTQALMLKASSSLWTTNHGTDSYGLSILPAGERSDAGTFKLLGTFANIWSATEYSATNAYYRFLKEDVTGIGRDWDYVNQSGGFSVRCVQD